MIGYITFLNTWPTPQLDGKAFGGLVQASVDAQGRPYPNLAAAGPDTGQYSFFREQVAPDVRQGDRVFFNVERGSLYQDFSDFASGVVRA